MAGTAELRGQVAELKEQISRLTALVEARTRLDSVEPEKDFSSLFNDNELTGAEAQETLTEDAEDNSKYESAFIPSNEELAKKQPGQKAA